MEWNGKIRSKVPEWAGRDHPPFGLLLLPFLLSFALTPALCPGVGGTRRRVEWRGKTRSKVQEWVGGGGDHGWVMAEAEGRRGRGGGMWVSAGCGCVH